MKLNRYAAFAWGVLVYMLSVIMWGAYVRATGSGAGCGNHWPKCNGAIIPRAPEIETLVEFSHRLMSALSALLVLGLVVWAWRWYQGPRRVRFAAAATLGFLVLEALVGAAQVRLDLVADNPSPARAVVGTIHLVNTFLLLAATLLTAWWASGGPPVRLRGQGPLLWLYGGGILATFVLGSSGAITALGDTLYPSSSLAEGLRQDFSGAAPLLIQLRVLHPLIATMTGAYLIAVAFLAHAQRPEQGIKPFAYLLTALFIIQLGAGVVNVVLLAPVWLQMVHLVLADLIWIALILAAATTFGARQPAGYAESPVLAGIGAT